MRTLVRKCLACAETDRRPPGVGMRRVPRTNIAWRRSPPERGCANCGYACADRIPLASTRLDPRCEVGIPAARRPRSRSLEETPCWVMGLTARTLHPQASASDHLWKARSLRRKSYSAETRAALCRFVPSESAAKKKGSRRQYEDKHPRALRLCSCLSVQETKPVQSSDPASASPPLKASSQPQTKCSDLQSHKH